MSIHLKKNLKKNYVPISTAEYIETLALKFSLLYNSCIYRDALRKYKTIF